MMVAFYLRVTIVFVLFSVIEPKQPVVFSPLSKTEPDLDLDNDDEEREDLSSSRKNSFLAVPGELNAVTRRLSF